MQNLGMFQQMLNAIEQALAPGAGLVQSQLLFWCSILLMLQCVHLGWRLVFGGANLQHLLEMLVRVSLVYTLLAIFPDLLHGAQDLFVRFGLTAGGGKLSVAQFLDPGEYLRTWQKVGKLLNDTTMANLSWRTPAQGLGYLVLLFALGTSFGVMAINVLIWQVEMLIVGLAVLILLPTLIFRSMAWMAQGALSMIVNLTFRFGVGALLASACFPVLEVLTITQPVSFESVFVSVVGGWVFAFAFWQVNKLAAGVLSGQPQFNAADVVSAAVGTVMALGGAVTAGSTVAAGATTGLLQAGRGGLATAQGLLGASRGAQLALTMTQGAAPMTRTLTALSAARSGAQTAIQQSPLVVRLGSLAGAQQQRARQQGGQSLRQLVDMSRYSGHDHGGYGVRR